VDRIRLNLANPQELLEIPGIKRDQVEAIIKFRADHGPIGNAGQLLRLLGRDRLSEARLAHIDFDPADDTAPEAPGA